MSGNIVQDISSAGIVANIGIPFGSETFNNQIWLDSEKMYFIDSSDRVYANVSLTIQYTEK